MQTLCREVSLSKSFLSFLLISNFYRQHASIISSVLFSNDILICFDHALCNRKQSKQISYFTFGQINIVPAVFLCSQVLFYLCVSVSFLSKSYPKLHVLLAQLLALSFLHHVSLYLAGSFVYPQVLSMSSGKVSFKAFQKPTEASSSLVSLNLLI